jgi:hypothetical protein
MELPMMRTALIFAAACLAASACSMTPTVTKSRMTLGEAHIEGMECRREAPIGSNAPRTVCASPESWAKYDKAQRQESEYAFQQARQRANVGSFNRQ